MSSQRKQHYLAYVTNHYQLMKQKCQICPTNRNISLVDLQHNMCLIIFYHQVCSNNEQCSRKLPSFSYRSGRKVRINLLHRLFLIYYLYYLNAIHSPLNQVRFWRVYSLLEDSWQLQFDPFINNCGFFFNNRIIFLWHILKILIFSFLQR